jgi:hypothetical protein
LGGFVVASLLQGTGFTGCSDERDVSRNDIFWLVREDFSKLTSSWLCASRRPPAARRILILPINQPITFEIKGSNGLVDRLKVLCFTASSAIHVWEFLYDFSAVGSSYQLLSHLFSVTVSEQCGASWCGILSSVYFCMTPK